MQVVKEYVKGKTKIRIHSDYITQENKTAKEMMVSLFINHIKNKNI